MGSRFKYNVKRTVSGKSTILARNMDFEEAVILTEMLQQRHELDYRIKVATNQLTQDEMEKQVVLTEFDYIRI